MSYSATVNLSHRHSCEQSHDITVLQLSKLILKFKHFGFFADKPGKKIHRCAGDVL